MMAVAGIGSSLLSGVMGGIMGSDEAAAEKMRFQQAEYERRMQNQRQNREIAKQNAQKWMNNIKIGEMAGKRRAEEEVYIERNYKNSMGQFSRNVKAANDSLVSGLRGKNIRGGTARALMRQTIDGANKAAGSMRIDFENRMRGAERRQEATLAKRDYGYQSGIPFMPGQDFTPDPSSIMTSSLAQGAVGAVFAGMSGYAQGSFLQGAITPGVDAAAEVAGAVGNSGGLLESQQLGNLGGMSELAIGGTVS